MKKKKQEIPTVTTDVFAEHEPDRLRVINPGEDHVDFQEYEIFFDDWLNGKIEEKIE